MVAKMQHSFAKGELSDDLAARFDTAAHQVGLKKARNVNIEAHGGVSNRTGTRFLGPVGDHTAAPRLQRFEYDSSDTYVLEFGAAYVRVIRNGGHVTEDGFAISAISLADPCVVTTAAHSYSNGDEVFLSGIVGTTELNQRRFIVANVAATTFELTDQNTLANIDSTGYTAWSSGGEAARIYTLTTPYAAADLFELNFVQSADVMTISHADYETRELSRTDHDDWSIAKVTFEPDLAHPNDIGITVNGADNGVTWEYMVAAIDGEGEESLPGDETATQTAITAATAANPVVITVTGHSFSTGDEIFIAGVAGMTELNNRRFFVTYDGVNTVSLDDEDGTSHTAYSSGGTTHYFFATTGAVGTTAADNTIAWTAVTGATKYAVYRKDNGLFSYIGETAEVSFLDEAISSDATSQPIIRRNPFVGSGNYPQAAGYYEQRRVMGGTDNSRDGSEYSRVGQFDDFTFSFPSLVTDAISVTLPALTVNQIRHYIPGNDLIVFTSGSEWKVSGSTDSGFSTSTIKQQLQSTWGCSFREPIIAGDTILFVPDNAASIRTLDFDFSRDKYSGTSLTLLADHLFKTYTIAEWAYGRSPDRRVYVVRSDGVVCSLTFDPEQDVIAWSTWDTLGKYESVATDTPNELDTDDHPYFVVKRIINGVTYRFIEYGASRRFTDIKDAFFVDSGLSLDSPVTITGITAANPPVVTAAAHGFTDGELVDLSDIIWTPSFDDVDTETQPSQLNGGRYVVCEATAGTFELLENNRSSMDGATAANPVVISAPAHGFTDGDSIGINGVLGMTELNGNVYKVANGTDDTFEITDEADVDIDGTAFTAYSSNGLAYPAVDGSAFVAYVESGFAREAVLTVSGLRHLASQEVSILADGNVVSGKSVSSEGVVTLDREASRVHVGLKYIADIETLNIEAPQGTIQGKRKSIPHVDLVLKDTRGLLYGPDIANLEELKQRDEELMGNPTDMVTDTRRVYINSGWDTKGRVFARQRDPLPVTVLGIVAEVEIGDDDQ